jgi:xanthine dehydrogenase accessory factor
MTCFSGGTLDVFIEPHQPRPQLLIVGSLPVAQALAHLGKAMSYRVSAVDPDGGQAMAHADRVVRDVSEITGLVTPLTFVVVATHGEFDEAGLSAALSSDAPYVALVASRKRGHAVMENLRAEGVEDAALARVKFPAGLDIGAKRGDEIALSIMAEIVQALRGMEAVSWTEAESVVDEFPPDTAVDPICQMTVKTEGALHTLEHEGTTYYFCCAGCRATFQADPTAYLGSPA